MDLLSSVRRYCIYFFYTVVYASFLLAAASSLFSSRFRNINLAHLLDGIERIINATRPEAVPECIYLGAEGWVG